jgi:hypothetical protein
MEPVASLVREKARDVVAARDGPLRLLQSASHLARRATSDDANGA